MINHHIPDQPGLVLESDLAGEFPLYLYWPQDQSTLLYSTSITELLNDARVPKPLTVSTEGLSFLLQSGVVPPPKTAYRDIFILGIGDKANVSTVNGKVDIQFSHEFPFLNASRLPEGSMQIDKNAIFEMLAEAVKSRLDKSKPIYLFHSAGKDSNPIAIALAKAGLKENVTLVTHRTKKKGDESEISKSIAQKLGFKHRILNEVEHLEELHLKNIKKHFSESPFPCTDNVSLVYPLYVAQFPELAGANIIDGMGSDVYIGHVPSMAEFKREKLSSVFKYFRWLSDYLPSSSRLKSLIRTRSEWTGLGGLSFKDSKIILPNANKSSSYWLRRDTSADYLDFRASVRGQLIDQEIYMRKVRNFTDAFKSNLIFPWTNPKIANYFSQMPEKFLIDRKNLRNKVLLRGILKEEIDLDSDKLGKMGYSYDSKTMVLENLNWIEDEIKNCTYWDDKGVRFWLDQQITHLKQSGLKSDKASMYIYKVFLVSSWLNHSRYIAR